MTDGSHTAERRDRLRVALTAFRWTVAAAAVAAIHGGVVWVALHWRPAEAAPSEPPPAVMIDLAPLAIAPPAPPQDVAAGPQMTEATPDPAPDTPTPVEQAKPDPAPPDTPQTVQGAKPDPVPPDVKLPKLPKKEKAAAVLAPPPRPKPKVRNKPPSPTHAVERQKPLRPGKKRVRQTTAPPASQAQPSDAAAAPSVGASFQASISPSSWKGELMAHLNRYKRYPAGATGSGTASIAFTINRSGQVLSSRLIGSSGDGALDAEAVSLPRRASPVPTPPPGFGGTVITLTVPIRFGG